MHIQIEKFRLVANGFAKCLGVWRWNQTVRLQGIAVSTDLIIHELFLWFNGPTYLLRNVWRFIIEYIVIRVYLWPHRISHDLVPWWWVVMVWEHFHLLSMSQAFALVCWCSELCDRALIVIQLLSKPKKTNIDNQKTWTQTDFWFVCVFQSLFSFWYY